MKQLPLRNHSSIAEIASENLSELYVDVRVLYWLCEFIRVIACTCYLFGERDCMCASFCLTLLACPK